MENTMDYLPVKRTAVEELKWIQMQARVDQIKKEMGEKWLLAQPVERLFQMKELKFEWVDNNDGTGRFVKNYG